MSGEVRIVFVMFVIMFVMLILITIFGLFCTPTPLSQFLRNSLRFFESPQWLKIIKRSSKSQRAWPGRSHELCCFATKLHTVITSVFIVWYDQNCSCSMLVPPWTRLHCDIDSQCATYWRLQMSRFYTFTAHSKRWQCSRWTTSDGAVAG